MNTSFSYARGDVWTLLGSLISMSILAGLICVPLALCTRYAFSRNDALLNIGEKLTGAPYLRKENKKISLRFLTALPPIPKGQPSKR